MSERLEENLMEDLGYDEAEGAAEMDELEGYDEYEFAEGGDLAAEDEWEGADEEFFAEGFEGEEFEDYGDEGSEDAMEDAMAYALGAEDTDEFFRRIGRGLRRIGGVVGRVARTAAPIARLIPGPYGQLAGTALGLLGRLRAEGASEDDAMDAFAEYAAYDEAAIPVAATCAARSVLRNRGARMPQRARRTMVRGMSTAARTLAQRRSPAAVRALPRIVRSVSRTAAARRTPVAAIPRIVNTTAANVARSGRLARRLSRPISTPIVRRVRRYIPTGPVPYSIGGRAVPRTFTTRGPVRITITGLS